MIDVEISRAASEWWNPWVPAFAPLIAGLVVTLIAAWLAHRHQRRQAILDDQRRRDADWNASMRERLLTVSADLLTTIEMLEEDQRLLAGLDDRLYASSREDHATHSAVAQMATPANQRIEAAMERIRRAGHTLLLMGEERLSILADEVFKFATAATRGEEPAPNGELLIDRFTEAARDRLCEFR